MIHASMSWRFCQCAACRMGKGKAKDGRGTMLRAPGVVELLQEIVCAQLQQLSPAAASALMAEPLGGSSGVERALPAVMGLPAGERAAALTAIMAGNLAVRICESTSLSSCFW